MDITETSGMLSTATAWEEDSALKLDGENERSLYGINGYFRCGIDGERGLRCVRACVLLCDSRDAWCRFPSFSLLRLLLFLPKKNEQQRAYRVQNQKLIGRGVCKRLVVRRAASCTVLTTRFFVLPETE